MLKKSNKISLEEATRLAILGKLPLMESKEVKKESTTVTTTEDGLTVVESDEATVVVEPKAPCADGNCGIPEGPVAEPVEEPVVDDPMAEPIEEPEMDTEELDGEPLIDEGKSHKLTIRENRVRGKKTETIEVTKTSYIDTFDELRNFCWGSAAESVLNEVERLGKEDELISYLEDVTGGSSDSTALNDIVAYDDMLEQELELFDYADEELAESKKVENKEVKTEGEAQLFKKKINKTDIKKVENKEVKEEAKKDEPKRNVINKVDLTKTEGKDCKNCKKEQTEEVKKFMENLNKKRASRKFEAKKVKNCNGKEVKLDKDLGVKIAEGLTKFLTESYKNGKEIKVEKVINLTENKLYVKGSLVMENSTKDFSCKLVPIKEGRTFRKYTIKENKTLKITEGKTLKGKSFEMILRK